MLDDTRGSKKNMNSRILVVGATGMLGEPVARQLQQDGYTIRVASRDTDKAKAKLGDEFEYVHGDVEQPETLRAALRDCYGVHINLAGKSTPESFKKIEHRGTETIAKLAAETGIQRLTYLSGTSVHEGTRWFYATEAKFQAEAAIKKSGVPYTIFRASWFMESLPLFIKGNKAFIAGKQPHPLHWVAANDYARMVSRAYRTPESANKTLYVYGPETYTMAEALRHYCALAQPKVKLSVTPLWLLGIIAAISRNPELQHLSRFMAYYNKFCENADAGEANVLLGAPTTTLQQWSQQQ